MSNKPQVEENDYENNVENLKQIIEMKDRSQSRLEKEKNQYEMMVLEQQKIIRLALARIAPNKNMPTRTKFCQVPL